MDSLSQIRHALAAVPSGDNSVKWLTLDTPAGDTASELSVCVQDWKQALWLLCFTHVRSLRKRGFESEQTFEHFHVRACKGSGAPTVTFGDYVAHAERCEVHPVANAAAPWSSSRTSELRTLSTADNSLRGYRLESLTNSQSIERATTLNITLPDVCMIRLLKSDAHADRRIIALGVEHFEWIDVGSTDLEFWAGTRSDYGGEWIALQTARGVSTLMLKADRVGE